MRRCLNAGMTEIRGPVQTKRLEAARNSLYNNIQFCIFALLSYTVKAFKPVRQGVCVEFCLLWEFAPGSIIDAFAELWTRCPNFYSKSQNVSVYIAINF